jgi:hypothetical protein
MEEYSWSADLKTSNVTLSNNNMTASVPNLSNAVLGSVGLTSGKWYWEISNLSGGNLHLIGVSDSGVLTHSDSKFLYPKSTSYYTSGNIYPENISYGMSFTTSDVIGVAIDIDNNKIEFFKNGVPQGVYTGDDYSQYDAVYPFLTSGSSTRGVGATILTNEDNLNYTIPEGYKPYGFQKKILISSSSGNSLSLEKVEEVNLVPTMTSNTAPKGIASASSEYSSDYFAWKAFDKIKGSGPASGWASSEGVNTGWLQYEFENPTIINKYKVTSRGTSVGESPKNWTFEGSNDGFVDDINTLHTVIDETNWSQAETREFSFINFTKYKMYRLNINSNNGFASYVVVQELEMFGQNTTLKQLPSKTEQDFINHGMVTTQVINPQEKMAQKQYINNTSATLGNGKVFEQPVDKYIKSLNVK